MFTKNKRSGCFTDNGVAPDRAKREAESRCGVGIEFGAIVERLDAADVSF
jgi:hypothetical protein